MARSKKEVDAMMQGAGWQLSFVQALTDGFRRHGWSNEDIHSLVTRDGEPTAEDLAGVVVQHFRRDIVTITVDPDAPTKHSIEQGWELENDVREPSGVISLELVEVPKDDKSYYGGEALVQLAKNEDAYLGLRHIEALIAVRRRMPEKWHSCRPLFPGATQKNRFGERIVPFLLMHTNDIWEINYTHLNNEDGFDSRYRLVRVCRPVHAGKLWSLETT